jgi:hypothetical protein
MKHMKDPTPKPKRSGPAARAPQPNTQPAQVETQDPVPRREFERDESADSQVADEPSMKDIGRIAKGDADRAIPDTTKGAELDRTYDRLRKSSD